tara:strand:+ start:6546 stop:8090 length:1545 start_codon:yes stop_codon:yes gene_type:complete
MNITITKLLLCLTLLTTLTPTAPADWPQAAGPTYDFVDTGKTPTHFSGTRGTNIRWRAKLPNTGQGTPVVVGDRVFIQCHEPIQADTEMSSLTVGLCFDANSGEELWRRELPAARTTDLSSLFSDNTAASAVATKELVAFVNVGGRISVFDHDGKQKWTYAWVPFGRHHSRQHEPFLFENQLIILKTIKDDLPISATTKAGSHPLGRGKEYWTHLHAFDLVSGKTTWIAKTGTGIHAASRFGIYQGKPIILTGRGGGHQPPEEPFGISRVNAKDGSTDWDAGVHGYPSAQNVTWNKNGVYGFGGQTHFSLDLTTGSPSSMASLTDDVSVTSGFPNYSTQTHQQFKPAKKAITYQTNIVVGDYHYFLSHKAGFIGRVHLKSNSVEYLQVPLQVVRNIKTKEEKYLLDKTLPNDMKNADGFLATQDRRNAGNGWGHVSAASPTVVGDVMYLPTMVGTVYVLKWNVDQFDENTLLSVSDLGPAGKTWTLSSLAHSKGRLYARTLKELICIETPQDLP